MNDKKSTPLREKMKADLMLRNYSKHSEELYLFHVRRFAQHYHKSPELLGLDEIRSYLLFLRERADVSQSSYKQTVAALRFLYKYTLGKEWLKEKIWPAEAKLRGEHVSWGTKLALLEMAANGVTAFGDMYFFMDSVVEASLDGEPLSLAEFPAPHSHLSPR